MFGASVSSARCQVPSMSTIMSHDVRSHVNNVITVAAKSCRSPHLIAMPVTMASMIVLPTMMMTMMFMMMMTMTMVMMVMKMRRG